MSSESPTQCVEAGPNGGAETGGIGADWQWHTTLGPRPPAGFFDVDAAVARSGARSWSLLHAEYVHPAQTGVGVAPGPVLCCS